MIIYRNLIIRDCAISWGLLSELPAILLNNDFERSTYQFFGVNLIPKSDAVKYIYNNSGYIKIDSKNKDMIDTMGDLNVMTNQEFTIQTTIEGLTQEQELAFILKFGPTEDIIFDG
jgi:hypothetical protein